MARDVTDDTYYVSSGGKVPVKWTAPEVTIYQCLSMTHRVNCDSVMYLLLNAFICKLYLAIHVAKAPLHVYVYERICQETSTTHMREAVV